MPIDFMEKLKEKFTDEELLELHSQWDSGEFDEMVREQMSEYLSGKFPEQFVGTTNEEDIECK